MKIPGNILILLFLATALLGSCKESVPTPSMSPTPLVATSTSPATVPPPTNTALPTISFDNPMVTPSPKPLLPTEVSVPIPGGIVYYHFINLAQYAPPQESVVIMPDNLVLAPSQLNEVYSSDVAADLRRALEAVLKDERNFWSGNKLQISELSYNNGQVNVALDGEYYAVAHVVLTAARAQILMSLFANAAVGSATVTINGQNIANIAISNSRDAKSADYTYTRAEIESFMSENAYEGP